MHLAYVDESGDSGARGSRSYSLGCVLVEDRQWLGAFDDLIEFRRYLFRQYKIPVRAELKANYLLHNGGPLRKLRRPLSEAARFSVYRGFMRLQAKLAVRVFAVVVRKETFPAGVDPRPLAWTTLLQRLERFTTTGDTTCMLVHDEGDAATVRKMFRRSRRAGIAGSRFGPGVLRRPARLLLDDPVARKSHESYLLQLADLDAYAAFRRLYAPPPLPVQIVPQAMWDELGAVRHAPANKYSGGPVGIVTVAA